MTTRSTAGLVIYLQKSSSVPVVIDGTDGSTTLTAIAADVTAATKTLVTGTMAGFADGDPVTFKDTGFPELDGKTFIVESFTATTFMVNADLTGTTGAFDAAKAEASILPIATAFEGICASDVSVDANTPGTIGVGTFCSPTESLPSVVNEPGNMTLTVFHDPTSAAFKALEQAVVDGNKITLLIQFPADGGTLIVTGTPSAFSISTVPLDGAASWTFTMAMSSKPTLRA